MAYVDNPDIDVDGLMEHIKGPDFPTGAYILGNAGIRSAYETGRGRVMLRAKAEIEAGTLHDRIVVRAVPYGTNTSDLVKSIAQLAKEGKVEGITNVNDESDREGMRIVVDVKRGQNANVVLNKLYKMTGLQTSFAVNCMRSRGAHFPERAPPRCVRSSSRSKTAFAISSNIATMW